MSSAFPRPGRLQSHCRGDAFPAAGCHERTPPVDMKPWDDQGAFRNASSLPCQQTMQSPCAAKDSAFETARL
jgi:hypothetical protein